MSIFLVMNGVIDGIVSVPHVFETQIQLLERAGCAVHLGFVDDRTPFGGILRNVRKLSRQIEQINPDLVIAHYGSVTSAVARLAKGNRPFIVFFRGSDILGTAEPGLIWRMRDKLAKWMGIWAAQTAQVVVVNGEGISQALPKWLITRVEPIPNGTDIDLFCPKDRDQCRYKLGWEIETKVVLFNASTGSSTAIKNPTLARETVKRVSVNMTNVRLIEMSKFTREEIVLLMNAADCLLVTSLHEGSPDIVKEAMACNLPIVTVPCGDVAERLNGTVPSSICPYDAQSLASAVSQILGSGARSNGRQQLLAQGLDANSISKRLLIVFSRAINRKQASKNRENMPGPSSRHI